VAILLRIPCIQAVTSAVFSTSSAISARTSATIVLSTKVGPAVDCVEPTIRNSNLLPVNAKGEVRLRSVQSFGRGGRLEIPSLSWPPCFDVFAPSAASCSKMSVSWSPRKIETIAGGASLAPSRCSLPALATLARNSLAYLSTALTTAQSTTKKTMLS